MNTKEKQTQLINQIVAIVAFYEFYGYSNEAELKSKLLSKTHDKMLTDNIIFNDKIEFDTQYNLRKNREDHKILNNNGIKLSEQDSMTICINLVSLMTRLYKLGFVPATSRSRAFDYYGFFQKWAYDIDAAKKIGSLCDKANELMKHDNVTFYNFCYKYGLQFNLGDCANIPIQGNSIQRTAIRLAHQWANDKMNVIQVGNLARDTVNTVKEVGPSKGAFISFSDRDYVTIPLSSKYDHIEEFLEFFCIKASTLNIQQLEDVRKRLDTNSKIAKMNRLSIIYTHVYGKDVFTDQHRSNSMLVRSHERKMYQYYKGKYPFLKLDNPVHDSTISNKTKSFDSQPNFLNNNYIPSYAEKSDNYTDNYTTDTTNKYKICPNCGNKCFKSDNFCTHCGHHFN